MTIPVPHDDGTRFVALADGGRIAYQSHGEGQSGIPILLLRPLGGSMALWGAFRETLATQFRVISFDYRGSGVSSEDPGWPTTRSLAQDALAVLSALSIDRAHVFGISLGGMTASWLAIKEPPRVVRLCLASAPARGIELSHAGMRRGAKMAVCFAKPDIDVEASLVDRVLSHAFRREHPDEVRRIEATVREHPASRTALLKHARAGALHDVSREVCVLRTPTLVLAGDHDSLLGTEAPRELAAAMPAAQFEVMQGTGHDLTLEQPVATAERVARFFREAP